MDRIIEESTVRGLEKYVMQQRKWKDEMTYYDGPPEQFKEEEAMYEVDMPETLKN